MLSPKNSISLEFGAVNLGQFGIVYKRDISVGNRLFFDKTKDSEIHWEWNSKFLFRFKAHALNFLSSANSMYVYNDNTPSSYINTSQSKYGSLNVVFSVGVENGINLILGQDTYLRFYMTVAVGYFQNVFSTNDEPNRKNFFNGFDGEVGFLCLEYTLPRPDWFPLLSLYMEPIFNIGMSFNSSCYLLFNCRFGVALQF